MDRNLYQVLGVSDDADLVAMKAAYRKLAYELHPDRTQGDKAKEDRFKDVQMAYAVLSDPDKRKAYDTVKHDKKHPLFGPEFDALVERIREEGIGSSNLSDLLADFFGVCQETKQRAQTLSEDGGSVLESLGDIFGIKLDIVKPTTSKRKGS